MAIQEVAPPEARHSDESFAIKNPITGEWMAGALVEPQWVTYISHKPSDMRVTEAGVNSLENRFPGIHIVDTQLFAIQAVAKTFDGSNERCRQITSHYDPDFEDLVLASREFTPKETNL